MITSAVLDHLWQSSLFALLVALLVTAFRKAPAAVRHGLWLAASIKFLIPFVTLAALGQSLAPAIRLPRPDAPEAALIAKAAQPFSQPVLAQAALLQPLPPTSSLQAPLSQSPAPEALAHPVGARVHTAPRVDLAPILLAVWLLGSAAVLVAWARRWAGLRKVVRSARPVDWPAPMPVLAAPSLLEPGLVGLWRPVLLMPATLPEHLTRSEIDAILAHEITHLRRRDNLTAAIHMLVEALFWFHPMVWWIGARMIEERERACDEAVLKAGHDRATYARSLLESCRLYLQSPLDCVAGASGSDLKSRVETIMTAPVASPLSLSSKAALAAAGALAFATPVAAGMLATPAGQKVAARAAAMAAGPTTGRAAPARGPNDAQQTALLALSREKSVLARVLSVAGTDLPNPALTQDFTAPRIEGPTAPAEPAPIQLAAAPPTPPVSQAVSSATPKQEADLTALYQAPTSAESVVMGRMAKILDKARLAARVDAAPGPLVQEVAKPRMDQGPAHTLRPAEIREADAVVRAPVARWNESRWSLTSADTASPVDAKQSAAAFVQSYGGAFWNTDDPICIRVEGLQPDKAASVKARVEADARAAGVSVGRAECGLRYQVEIRFAADADRAVSDVINYYHHPIWPFPMERPAGADRPIRAWYGLTYDHAGAPGGQQNLGSNPGARQKLDLAIVVVDPQRTQSMSLGAVSDYAAMLALAQPRSLDRCNVLPSVTDLFARACSGRAAPTGLTAADVAYLKALYTGSSGLRASRYPSELVDRMARLLGPAKLAAL